MTLNNSEWTIMEKLWEQPYTMMQLYHILEEETGWSKSTVVTMLGRNGRQKDWLPTMKAAGQGNIIR